MCGYRARVIVRTPQLSRCSQTAPDEPSRHVGAVAMHESAHRALVMQGGRAANLGSARNTQQLHRGCDGARSGGRRRQVRSRPLSERPRRVR